MKKSKPDPRYQRSRERLQDAIWTMAQARPATQIGVAELCRAAGVTRDTFYRHAASPAELLADLVRARVHEIAQVANARGAEEPDVLEHGMRMLLAHIAAHADLYRNATEPRSGAPLRAVFEETFGAILHQAVELSPDLLPATLQNDALGSAIAIAYAAAGAAGAIRIWLMGEELDAARGAKLILAASPAFWGATRA